MTSKRRRELPSSRYEPAESHRFLRTEVRRACVAMSTQSHSDDWTAADVPDSQSTFQLVERMLQGSTACFQYRVSYFKLRSRLYV